MDRLVRNILFLLTSTATVSGGIVHRYNFNGEGQVVVDSIGGADATLVGGANLNNSGVIALDGSNDLVKMPAGLISKLKNTTLEAWVVWSGPATSSWQNIFLLGNGSNHYLYLSPRTSNSPRKVRFGISGGGAERKVNGKLQLPGDGVTRNHLAVSYDDDNNRVSLYIDGMLQSSTSTTISLADIEDTENYLGKPLFNGFPYFKGRIEEFRIHDKALSAEKIKKSSDLGPDMLPGPIINLFQADSDVVRSNAEVALTWDVSSGAAVSIEPDILQDGANTGSIKVNVAESTAFTLTATDEDGFRTSRILVVVDDRPVINSFTFSADQVSRVGDSASLSWDVSFADFLQIQPDTPAIVGATGSVDVPIRATTRFTLLARNRHGASTASVEVPLPETGPLKISEFLADNDEGHADDHGEFSDWIEIYNSGTSTQNLSRWSLSDTPENLTKWTFPAGTTLSRGQRLMVYASGRGVPGPGRGVFHCNFKLETGKGGYLSLVRDDGVVGSMYSDYASQRENISQGVLESGRLPAGGSKGDVAYFTTPTPGQTNRDGNLGFVKDTNFSHKRGFHEDPFTLQITTSTPDALIYYTLDGSEPSLTHGTLYQGPFEISTTSCVRACAYKDGLYPTNVDTQTYLFLSDVVRQSPSGQAPAGWPGGSINGQMMSYGMDPDIVFGFNSEAQVIEALKSISTMSIVTDLDHLFDSSQGIYVNAGRKGKSWERPSSLELIHPDGTKGFQINMGLRIRGGYSRTSRNPKHSFRVFFRGEYGEGSLKYPLFGEEGSDRFDKFDFRTSQNYSWAFGGPNKNTMVREVFSRDVQGTMGWSYTRSRYYHIYINGIYWGMYQTQERVGADYCANYNGGNPEDYDVLKQADNRNMSATAGQINDYNLFWEQANAGFKNDANYYRAQGLNPDGVTPNPAYRKYLDVDNLIDYMIITYWTADRDGPGSKYTRPRPNNYYCFFNRENPDGFKFMEHDSEHSLGANENNMVTPRLTDDSRTSKKEWFNAHWLHERLTEHPEYVVRFYDRVYKHLNNDGVFVPANAIQRINFRANQIDKAIIAESARWGDQKTHPPRNRNNWLSDVQSIRNWINNREPTFLGQLRGQGWYPDIDPPNLSKNGGQVNAGQRLTMSSSRGTIYYTLDETDPRARGGSVSSTAKRYTSSILLPGPRVVVKSRVQNGSEWSPLRETIFLVGAQPANAGTLAITEIQYNPVDPTVAELALNATLEGNDFEYIEFKNHGNSSINLAGVTLTDGVAFTFGDVNLDPGERTLIVSNRVAFELRYGTGHNIAGEFAGSLRNSGETLQVVDASGNDIRKFEYKDSGSWPGRADGKGSSLEIVDSKSDPGVGSNWRSSSEFGGTPGQAGQGADNRVVINEVLTHTDPPLKDSIEIHNTTDQSINLSGWLLSDNSSNFHKYRFPDGVNLGPSAYLVLTEDQFNPDPTNSASSGFALSSGEGDSVWLVEADADGAIQRFVDHVEFSAARNGESFGRWPNATGKLYPMASRSLGRSNTGPRVGPVVISEIHYNPKSGNPEEEFIEISNPTSSPINLNNWRLRGGVDYDFPAWANLPAGGILLLVNFNSDDPYKVADFKGAHGIKYGVSLLGPWKNGNLDNGGQVVRIERPDTLQEEPGKNPFYPMLLEDEVKYNDASPWPLEPDGAGSSLQRRELSGWGQDAGSWQAAVPTPGKFPGLGNSDADSDGMPDDWEQLHFGNADQSPTADYDNDGLPNLLEYALGSYPANPSSVNMPSTALEDGQFLTVTFQQLTEPGGLTYTIEVADELGAWQSGNGITEIISSVEDGDYTTVTIRDRTDVKSKPKRFLRIVVESP